MMMSAGDTFTRGLTILQALHIVSYTYIYFIANYFYSIKYNSYAQHGMKGIKIVTHSLCFSLT
jgi:hypothetical protein